MAAPSRTPAIEVSGIRDLRRDLRVINRTLDRELSKELREAVRPVLREAVMLTPKRSGKLAGSLRPYASGSSVGIRSRLPYANPIHWGWPSRKIAASEFITRAVKRNTDDIVDALGDAVENVAKRNGF